MFQAALKSHQPGFTMSLFHTSPAQHDRSLAEIKQCLPALRILRWFNVQRLSIVFSPIDLLGPAGIVACTEDLTDPHIIDSFYFSHSSVSGKCQFALPLIGENKWSVEVIFAGIRSGLGMSS